MLAGIITNQWASATQKQLDCMKYISRTREKDILFRGQKSLSREHKIIFLFRLRGCKSDIIRIFIVLYEQ